MLSGTGHCLCGKTTYKFNQERINWQGICHCESCRRAAGAAMVGCIGVKNGHWSWEGQAPGEVASSSHATRYFCASCGTAMGYFSTRWDYEMHFLAASLSDPENFSPTFHCYTKEKLPWVQIADDLRCFEGSADGN